jgi:uncharacterized phage protein (TIGR01671 family)
MRELKFRVWDNSFNKMLLLHEAKFADGSLIGAKGINWDSDVVVMQYTGIKDVKEKEIYEGDIVSLDNGHIDTVGFHEGCFLVENAVMHYEATYWPSDIEVLGNIYENKELLNDF